LIHEEDIEKYIHLIEKKIKINQKKMKDEYLISGRVCERGKDRLFARCFSIRPKRVGSPSRG
jgi:hypothetical protein